MISVQSLTLYEAISIANYILIFITIIISVTLVLHQTREMSSQTQTLIDSFSYDVYQNVTMQIFAIDQIFITYPEIRPYFYSGKEISENDPNYQRVLATAEFFLDLFGTSFDLIPRYPKNWTSYESWLAYIQGSFATSPILCAFLDSHRDWYHTQMVDLMEAARREQNKVTDHT